MKFTNHTFFHPKNTSCEQPKNTPSSISAASCCPAGLSCPHFIMTTNSHRLHLLAIYNFANKLSKQNSFQSKHDTMKHLLIASIFKYS